MCRLPKIQNMNLGIHARVEEIAEDAMDHIANGPGLSAILKNRVLLKEHADVIKIKI